MPSKKPSYNNPSPFIIPPHVLGNFPYLNSKKKKKIFKILPLNNNKIDI